MPSCKMPIRDFETCIDDYLCGETTKHIRDYTTENVMTFLWDTETVIEIMIHEEIYSLIGEENV